jgi:putative endonuclease
MRGFLFLEMSWYVYIIQSEKDGTYYKGSSERPLERLQEHNAGLSRYTSGKLPWKLVYVEELPSKKEMLIREKKLKRGNADFFQKLINGDKNIVTTLR